MIWERLQNLFTVGIGRTWEGKIQVRPCLILADTSKGNSTCIIGFYWGKNGKCIIRVKHHTQHTFVFQNERCQYSSHSHSQQTNQTPSVKPVHRKGPHNRFSCPAKSNTFSHRGPDYHQCMNGIALSVACVPLWICTCEEGNCMELQWKGQDQSFYPWISWKDSQIVLWITEDSSIKSQALDLLFSASDGCLFNVWHILHTKLESPFEFIISQKVRLVIKIEKEKCLLKLCDATKIQKKKKIWINNRKWYERGPLWILSRSTRHLKYYM